MLTALRYLRITVHLRIHPCKTGSRGSCVNRKTKSLTPPVRSACRRSTAPEGKDSARDLPHAHLSERTLRCPSSDRARQGTRRQGRSSASPQNYPRQRYFRSPPASDSPFLSHSRDPLGRAATHFGGVHGKTLSSDRGRAVLRKSDAEHARVHSSSSFSSFLTTARASCPRAVNFKYSFLSPGTVTPGTLYALRIKTSGISRGASHHVLRKVAPEYRSTYALRGYSRALPIFSRRLLRGGTPRRRRVSRTSSPGSRDLLRLLGPNRPRYRVSSFAEKSSRGISPGEVSARVAFSSQTARRAGTSGRCERARDYDSKLTGVTRELAPAGWVTAGRFHEWDPTGAASFPSPVVEAR